MGSSSLVAQLVKNLPTMRETWVQSLGWEDPLEKENGYPLQYSGLENSKDCIVHGVAKSRTQLSDCHIQGVMDIKMEMHLIPVKYKLQAAICICI